MKKTDQKGKDGLETGRQIIKAEITQRADSHDTSLVDAYPSTHIGQGSTRRA